MRWTDETNEWEAFLFFAKWGLLVVGCGWFGVGGGGRGRILLCFFSSPPSS